MIGRSIARCGDEASTVYSSVDRTDCCSLCRTALRNIHDSVCVPIEVLTGEWHTVARCRDRLFAEVKMAREAWRLGAIT
jgi:hypothetical protein